MTRLAFLLTVASALLTGREFQSAPSGVNSPEGAISGRITAADGGPIADALVTIWALDTPANAQVRRQLTDDLGRFVFTGLRGGNRYSVRARKSGYLEGAFGRATPENPAETPIALAPRAWFPRADVTLWRAASLAGRVRDESDNPVTNVLVRLLAYSRLPNGETVLAGGPFTQSDDRGRFSFEDLLPGEYFAMVPSPSWSNSGASLAGSSTGRLNGQFPLAAALDGSSPLVYPAMFSGSMLSPRDAHKTRLGVGDAVEDVDIRLRPVVSRRLAGRLTLQGAGVEGVFIRLVQPGLADLGFGSEAAATRSGVNGRFEFIGVPSGEYIIDIPLSVNEFTFAGGSMSYSYGSPAPRPPGFENAGSDTVAGTVLVPGLSVTPVRGAASWFQAPLLVGSTAPDRPLEIGLKPAATLTGSIIVETDPQRPAPRTRPGVLWLEGEDLAHGKFSAVSLSEAPEGTFAFRSILPGSYWIRSSGSDWLIKTISVDGQDRTHAPLEVPGGGRSVAVTVTNASAELSGTILGDSATVVDVYLVPSVLASDPGRLLRGMRTTRATTGGTYAFAKVPAGDYLVFALRDGTIKEWTPSVVASAVAAAERVVLQWGAPARTDLRDVSARVRLP